MCVCIYTGMEGDGEVIIGPVQNCSHCESGECYDVKDSIVCYCDEGLNLAPDRVSCINDSGQDQLHGTFTHILSNIKSIHVFPIFF